MRRRKLGLAAALVVALVVVTANARVLARGDRDVVSGPPSDAPFDCALVLGAGVSPEGIPSYVLGDRLEEALSLYRSGRVGRLLVSGDHQTGEYDEPGSMRAWLEKRGVPRGAIFMDHAGVDTYSSVWRAKHVFGARRIVVVTQKFHLPRALFVARSLGMEAEAAVADRRPYERAIWFEAREVGSRTKAFLDVARGRRPRHVGPAISLDGDASATEG